MIISPKLTPLAKWRLQYLEKIFPTYSNKQRLKTCSSIFCKRWCFANICNSFSNVFWSKNTNSKQNVLNLEDENQFFFFFWGKKYLNNLVFTNGPAPYIKNWNENSENVVFEKWNFTTHDSSLANQHWYHNSWLGSASSFVMISMLICAWFVIRCEISFLKNHIFRNSTFQTYMHFI